jgi:hypothetical protein
MSSQREKNAFILAACPYPHLSYGACLHHPAAPFAQSVTGLIMKTKMKVLSAIAASFLLISASAQTSDDSNAAEAKVLVKEFFTTLKGELQGAISSGGPVSAIQVCKERAPAIAQTLSEKSGWEVGRTSLKLRNPASNAPDAWETQVLQDFEERKAGGEDVQTMAFAEVVESNGKSHYRFMKAIPTGELCLLCHGEAINPDIAEAIDEAYPDDQARGFALGDIRGAFTLSKPL